YLLRQHPARSALWPYTTLFRSALQVARLQLVARRRRVALGHRLEQLLEAFHVLRRDHVQQRHAFDVLEVLVAEHLQVGGVGADVDRKSTRLNSSHVKTSYAVLC